MDCNDVVKDKTKYIMEVFEKKIHVELDTYINCDDGCSEEDRILGRIESLASVIRFLKGRTEQ